MANTQALCGPCHEAKDGKEKAARRYWVVWRIGGDPPRCLHKSPEKARAEAERLAALLPGHEFRVFAADDLPQPWAAGLGFPDMPN